MSGLESDLFRSAVQGGSFGVLVLILLYGVIRLEPAMRERDQKKDEAHAAAIAKKDELQTEQIKEIVRVFGESSTRTATETRTIVETLVRENRLLLDQLVKRNDEHADKQAQQCREERKEWMVTVTAEMAANREAVSREMELNRKSRHDFANQIHKVVAEVLEEGEDRGRRERDEEDPDKRRRSQM